MNYKKLAIITIMVLSLVLFVGAVSAENSTATEVSDNSHDTAAADNTQQPTQTTTNTVKKKS